jgi:16S rRNA (adenine1518-N6/adenine1519-N6)-dimethyltransferase
VNVHSGARPRKSLGQHWLTDRGALRRIVDSAEIRDDETVIEIGAGTGLLTSLLAERAGRLIAVEVDDRLVEQLRERFAGRDAATVLASDVLETGPEELLAAGGGTMPYIVVGNLPYFIGTAIVRHFLESRVRPRRLVVTLQAEVAESIAAQPGRMSYLGVEMQSLTEAKLLFHLPPRAFKPPPKVRSAVVRLDVLDTSDVEVDDREAFLALVRAGFAAPRKRVRNSLAIGLRIPPSEAGEMLSRIEVSAEQRPSNLSLDDWRELYFAYRSGKERGDGPEAPR